MTNAMEPVKRLQIEAKGAAFRRLTESAYLNDPRQDLEKHIWKFPVISDR